MLEAILKVPTTDLGAGQDCDFPSYWTSPLLGLPVVLKKKLSSELLITSLLEDLSSFVFDWFSMLASYVVQYMISNSPVELGLPGVTWFSLWLCYGRLQWVGALLYPPSS